MRKHVFGISDQVQHKQGCTATEDGLRLESSDLESKCKMMQLTNKHKKIQALYTLNGTVLENIESIKYLGVTITLLLHILRAGFIIMRLISFAYLLVHRSINSFLH